MTNLLLRYGVAVAFCLACTGTCFLCVIYTDQSPSTRLYRTVPLSLTWAFGGLTFYSLLQMIFPSLDAPRFDTLGIVAPLGFGALADIYFLWRRARYVEDTSALLLLLFALFVILMVDLAGILPHPAFPPSFLAFYAAWCAIGSASLFPCFWIDRWLQAHLGPILQTPAFLRTPQALLRPPRRKRTWMAALSGAGAIISLVVMGWLAFHHQLASFVVALPWTAGLMLGLYLLGTAVHWSLRWLFQSRPLYSRRLRPLASSGTIAAEPSGDRQSSLATSVTVTAEPFDDLQQEAQQIYQGPTTPAGDIPPAVRARMDELLQSGSAAFIFYRFDNGGRGSQFLPSYCTFGWPSCMTCSCRQAASQLPPLTTQEGEE